MVCRISPSHTSCPLQCLVLNQWICRSPCAIIDWNVAWNLLVFDCVGALHTLITISTRQPCSLEKKWSWSYCVLVLYNNDDWLCSCSQDPEHPRPLALRLCLNLTCLSCYSRSDLNPRLALAPYSPLHHALVRGVELVTAEVEDATQRGCFGTTSDACQSSCTVMVSISTLQSCSMPSEPGVFCISNWWQLII